LSSAPPLPDNPMTIQDILLPLFVQVILTFVLMFGMMYHRMVAFRSGAKRFSEIAFREPYFQQSVLVFSYAL
jgi:hypothetical protein